MREEEKARSAVKTAPEMPPWRLSGWALVAIVVGVFGLTWLLGKLPHSQQLTPAPTSSLALAAVLTDTQPATATISPTTTWTVTIAPLTQTSTITLTLPPTNTLVPSLEISSTKISQLDGRVLVYVPAGNFLMGSDKTADPLAYDDELPQHTVFLDAYWIDQILVTNALYTLCVTAGSCTVPYATRSNTRSDYYGSSQYADYPVIYVDWSQANTYCQWAGRRLPTEAEWEKAARGTDGRIYPWGNQAPDATLANFGVNVGDTSKVGSYPAGASPYGALDMAGNVWEWVTDWYSATFYQISPSSNPIGSSSGDLHVVRGGSWYNDAQYVRSAFRFGLTFDYRNDGNGFRCAASP